MLPYTEGNYEATLSTQTFVRGVYDFPKWSAWGDAKSKKMGRTPTKKNFFIKRERREIFQKKLLSKCV